MGLLSVLTVGGAVDVAFCVQVGDGLGAFVGCVAGGFLGHLCYSRVVRENWGSVFTMPGVLLGAVPGSFTR